MKVIEEHGASFFDELAEGSSQLKPQVEEALGELVDALTTEHQAAQLAAESSAA